MQTGMDLLWICYGLMLHIRILHIDGGNLITWRNKKQSVITRSNAEEGFRVMTHGVCKILWLKIPLKELGYDS
jgi:hypothetical protein